MTSKSEECPRRLEYIVRTWYRIRYEFDTKNINTTEQVAINKEVD